jgi:hypothetical protein
MLFDFNIEFRAISRKFVKLFFLQIEIILKYFELILKALRPGLKLLVLN